jgi:GGDEF domain-containing protein
VVPLQLFAVLVTVPPQIVAVLVRQRTEALRRLDGALESMADGFALYDADDRLVICNRRYQDYLAPIADLLRPGARSVDLLQEGARRGALAAAAGSGIGQLIRPPSAQPFTEVMLGDGRWLQIASRATTEDGTVLVCRDITERKLLEQTLEHMAMHDPLTDLPNRKLYDLELKRGRARARRDGHHLALMLLDLDHFKEVNDRHGHQVGDQLLVEVARRLVGCVRTGDVVARVGGDEFAVVAESSDGTAGFTLLAERILRRLSEPVRLAG